MDVFLKAVYVNNHLITLANKFVY